MRPYIVRQGDYLAQMAFRFRFDAEAVWNDPKNEALRRQRPNPQELTPGDTLFIPDEPPAPVSVKPRTTNRYKATVPTVELRYTLREGDTALAGEPYEILGLPRKIKGTTDSAGKLSYRVPLTARQVEIFFPELRVRVPILVGGIDSIHTDSGVNQRLGAMGMFGWSTDRLDGTTGLGAEERRRWALAGFQRRYGLPPTGDLDDATRTAIDEAYQGKRQPTAGSNAR